MSDERNDNDSLFKSRHYFSLGDAVDEVSLSCGAKETTLAGAKLLGKTLFNTALFAGKAGVEIAKKLPDVIANKAERSLKENPNIEPEKREKMEDFIEKHKNSKR
jgi:hypothetical protein